MSVKGMHAVTPYLVKMEEAIAALVGEGWDAFNQDQLADQMKVNKTDSFRKRLDQIVKSGRLISWAYYTEKGGIGKAYARPQVQQQLLPDQPF